MWPAVALVILATALAVAAMRSGASRVLVYNETGASIAELGITACGQSQLFRNVADGTPIGPVALTLPELQRMLNLLPTVLDTLRLLHKEALQL